MVYLSETPIYDALCEEIVDPDDPLDFEKGCGCRWCNWFEYDGWRY